MDKNMINIDDLVRQRLSHAEEQGSSGGWMQMRELLDQKMPVDKAMGGYNWRRIFGMMTGLVLLASLTVGGYRVMTTTGFRNDDAGPLAASTGKTGTTPAAYSPSATPTAASGNLSETKDIAKKTSVASASNGHTTTNADLKKNDTKNVTGNIAANKKAASSETSPREPKNKQKQANKTSAIAITTQTDSEQKDHDHIPGDLQIGKKTTPAENSNNLSQEPVLASGNKMVAASKSKNLSSLVAQPLTVNAAAVDNVKVTVAPTQPSLKKDTFQQLMIVQRYEINPRERTGRFVRDTVSAERMIVDRSELNQLLGNVENTEPAASAKEEHMDNLSALILSASSGDVKMLTEDNNEFIPLSAFKVKSQRTKAWNPRSFDEVMRDVRFNLTHVKFYPGVTAGANWNKFGTDNLLGFHLGVTGQFTYGDWSVMAELKYMQRKNSGAVLRDNYTEIKQDNGQYLQGKVEHFFKFPNVQSVEMPLTLRFAMGRLNLIGGINPAYYFDVSAEEITHNAEAFTPILTSPNWNSTKPTIGYDDFKARIGLGGVIGVSYQLSPALQLDIRTVKNFWDNSNGNGAYKVSQQLFRPASFQISAGYRFSQRNKIPSAR